MHAMQYRLYFRSAKGVHCAARAGAAPQEPRQVQQLRAREGGQGTFIILV